LRVASQAEKLTSAQKSGESDLADSLSAFVDFADPALAGTRSSGDTAPVTSRPSHFTPQNRLVATGALLGGLAVMLGAFGAHALDGRLGTQALGWWRTAVEYQLWHALAVLALGLSGRPWTRLPAWLMAGGAVVFSATLYAMALGAPRWLGAVTPLGGLFMIAGWALVAWRALRGSGA
jgi:uncharacterized membrane protein YgdD (TMEM256/DUF423 family)